MTLDKPQVLTACLYRLPNRVLVHPMCRAETGLLLAGEPYLTMPTLDDDETLASAVVRALEHAGRLIPHPTDWKAFSAPMLAAAGVSSMLALHRKASLVHVHQLEDGLSVEPTHNGGTKGDTKGFCPVDNANTKLPRDCTAHQLAEAIRQAFSRCTSAA